MKSIPIHLNLGIMGMCGVLLYPKLQKNELMKWLMDLNMTVLFVSINQKDLSNG